MSDDLTTGAPEDRRNSKDKRSDYERANAKGDVSPSVEYVFDFLDSLFVDEKNFPEHIDVRQVVGRNLTEMGQPVRKLVFGSATKPTREKLVAMSNEIIDRCKKDCSVRQRETVYHIAAYNPQLSDEFYERILYRAKPTKTWSKRGEELGINGENGDDEDMPFATRYNIAQLDAQHRERGLIYGMIEGLIDRSDRQAAAAFAQLEKAQIRNIELLEINMRLVQADDERQERRERSKMWRENVSKGLDMAWGLLPPMLSSFTGKNGNNSWTMGSDSAEAMTLRKFFETKESGGLLEREQFEIICGTPGTGKDAGKIVKPGILTPEQVQLIVQIAEKQANPDQVDLLLPNGPMEILKEQIMEILKAGIPMEALAPIKMLLDVRMAKRDKNESDKEK